MSDTETSPQEHVLDGVPPGKGVLLTKSGKRAVVDGPFDEKTLPSLIGCAFFQMVPATRGKLADKALLLMDEDGKMSCPAVNELATREVGNQVAGGKLHGNILVLHPDDLE